MSEQMNGGALGVGWVGEESAGEHVRPQVGVQDRDLGLAESSFSLQAV